MHPVAMSTVYVNRDSWLLRIVIHSAQDLHRLSVCLRAFITFRDVLENGSRFVFACPACPGCPQAGACGHFKIPHLKPYPVATHARTL